MTTATAPTLADVRAAAARLAGTVRHTPCERSRTFSELCGVEVWLKYENVQRTGSYKLRGALNHILLLPEEVRRRGVIAASAGNHAQGVAVAAALAGVPATIVMPRTAPLAKVAATRGYGARVVLHGDVFDDAQVEAWRLREAEGLAYVPPFDDPLVIAGQGTVALEILADLPRVATIVVPIGGGGLIAGIALTAKALRPGVRIVGVQASGANATYRAFHNRYTGPLPAINTIADGIAVRAPGRLTLPLIRKHVDDVVTVDDAAITQAAVLLVERAKTIAEPAGAVALAALLSGAVPDPAGPVCVVLSGGNVDLNLIDRILQRGLGAAGRHLRLRARLIDSPGVLHHLTGILGDNAVNIIDVVHQRLGPDLAINEVYLELTLEVRDRAHGREVLDALRAGGYAPELMVSHPQAEVD